MSPITGYLLLILSSVLSAAADSPTVYQVLKSYKLPAGLLPQGVTSYEVDSSTGKFSVYLNKSCSFAIEGYDLKYKSTITGTVSTGRIKDLKGIQVKVLLFCLNITEVTKDDNELEFSVGILSASFQVDNFDECPQCGCVFDCVKFSPKSIFKMILLLVIFHCVIYAV